MSIAQLKPILIAAAVVAVLAVAGVGAASWLAEHDARTKAEAQTAAEQKQLDALRQQNVQTQTALAGQVKTIEREKTAPATAKQIVAGISSFVPKLPAPLTVTTQAADPKLPDAPAQQQIVVPQSDFEAIRNAALSCQESGDKLAACSATGKDLQSQLAVTTAQRDQWEKAAKGGSFWKRALADAKWFAIGASIGGGAVAAAHHK